MKPNLSDFENKQIGEFASDVAVLERMIKECCGLLERNTECGRGSCLLDGVEVLIRGTLEEYKSTLYEWTHPKKETAGNESEPQEIGPIDLDTNLAGHIFISQDDKESPFGTRVVLTPKQSAKVYQFIREKHLGGEQL